MDRLIADLLGLPEWAPRLAKQTAAIVLAATALCAPHVFQRGVEDYVAREQQRILDLFEPVINAALTPPAPADRSGPRDQNRRGTSATTTPPVTQVPRH